VSAARALVEAARRLVASGLNSGKAGNLSVRMRDGEGFCITPSGLDPEAMRVADIVRMGWDGTWQAQAAGRRPSSEWRFHRDILAARAEFGAVVHAHPVAATALAVHGRGIGPFHYMVTIAGGRDIRSCLMPHHGMVACGEDLDAAIGLAVEVETLAKQYLAALFLGEPPELSEAEIDAVLAKFAAGPGYGSAPGGEP